MIYNDIADLVTYGIQSGLITETDKNYAVNELLELFHLEEYEAPAESSREICLEKTLCNLLDYAYEKGILQENGVVYRDLFDTKIMGLLTPRPHEVVEKFWNLYNESPAAATDYFYKLSQDTDYIRRYRICKDVKWTTDTRYGTLDITINLSKPEKDPKAIAAACAQTH